MYEKQRHVVQGSIIPTYHQTKIMCYRKPLSLRHSPHTLPCLSSGINLVLIFNYVLSQRILVRTFLQHQLSFRLYCLGGNLVQTVHQTQLSVLRNWHFIAIHSICLGKHLVLPVPLGVRTFRQHHTSFRLCVMGKTRFRPVHQSQLSNIHN